MHITAIETIHLAGLHRVAFARVETDAGLVGVGETYDKAAASIAAIHETVAPLVLGREPRDISGLSHLVRDQIRFHGRSGAELRGLSAVEMALWDIAGQAAGVPVYQLLGGRCRESIPVYNTCVSHGANRDHERFMSDPAGLAEELRADGFTAAKIWPFDRAAEQYLGQRIDAAGLAEGVRPVAAMREAGLDVGIEMHGRWSLGPATAIAKAVEPYAPLFMEEALPAERPRQLRALKESTTVPLVGSEWLLSRADAMQWLEAGATQILMTDPSWNGGLLETWRTSTLADSFGVPLVFHSCGGPLTHQAALHVAATIPNLYAVETVRAFQTTVFRELADLTWDVRDGFLPAPDPTRPGLGVTLADLGARSDATVQRSESERLSDSGRYSLGDCWDDPAWSGSDEAWEREDV